jgi:hypothetical protein
MREATGCFFIGSIAIIMAISPFVLYKIDNIGKLNLSEDEYRFSNECEKELEQESKAIDRLMNKMKLIYIVFILTLIDTAFLYEPTVLNAFNANRTLICSFENKDIEVNNKTFKYTQTNRFFNSGTVTKIDDSNISMKLSICKIKNKKWWE